jgi:hypothetical protein
VHDYRWPIVLAGHFSMNTGADRMAAPPTAARSSGDWHGTVSTHWFPITCSASRAERVQGNAAMFNIHSGLDRNRRDQRQLDFSPRTARQDWGIWIAT